MTNFIDKIKKDTEIYVIHAEEATHASTADNALTADNVNKIGNVEKFSLPGTSETKPKEGLKFKNHNMEAIIDLNYNASKSTGNLEIESFNGHVNLESSKGIQIKPTTKVILDSTRRIVDGKGNEVHLEAKFDDYDRSNEGNYDGDDEEWAEFKIHSRKLDLRCHGHGGIALQIAGHDKNGHENKIKFESDRITPITEQGDYNGEGGKGLEFGTFNNEHSSLFTGDYRFNKNGAVYAVVRDTPVYDGGKTDYPTNNDDDFKDIINESTPSATWNSIVTVANKYRNLKDYTTESEVQAMITERAAELAGGGSISLDGYATETYVDNAIEQIETGAYEPGNGISIIDNVISVNHYSDIDPLTSLTKNLTALSTMKIGKEKGNLKVDVKGKYTYEAKVDAIDEFGNEVLKGGRVVNYIDEDFYNDQTKYYYKSLVNGTYENTNQYAKAGSFAYKKSVMTSIEPGTYFYTAKKNARLYSAEGQGEIVEKGTVVIQTSSMAAEEIEYYDCKLADNKWTKGYVIADGDNEEFYENWEKVSLWIKNEININLETDSKIKFDGKKIETTWAYPETEGGDEVDHKMDEIALTTENLVIDATNVNTEKKITKNGDLTEEPMLNYYFENKLYDENGEIAVTEEEFLTNFKGKHPDTTLTDEEIAEKYHEFLLYGPNETITVKVSDLLKLVERVNDLENRILRLENPE